MVAAASCGHLGPTAKAESLDLAPTLRRFPRRVHTYSLPYPKVTPDIAFAPKPMSFAMLSISTP